MLVEGNIIYFDPFYFKNGNTAKPKYFVVLKINGTSNIIASLPTRKNIIPVNAIKQQSGCVELPVYNLNCFVISENEEITECGKYFDFQTHIYGHQIDDYEVSLLEDIYRNEGTDYVIFGKMKADIFHRLLECLRQSASVKRKYKKLL